MVIAFFITQNSDVRKEHSIWLCYENQSPSFYLDLVALVYLTLLQIMGIVLAFQTRRVKIRVLNDSKFVAALVYISSIVLIIIILVHFILRSYINITGVVFSGGFIILVTFFLVLTFIPKVSCKHYHQCLQARACLQTKLVKFIYNNFIIGLPKVYQIGIGHCMFWELACHIR